MDLNIRNVDPILIRTLKARAAERGMTLRAFCLAAFDLPAGALVESVTISQPTPTAHRSPLSIPGVFLGSQLAGQTVPVYEPEPESLELPMCSYTEYDGQTGETYACGLRVHSNKIKHTRGAVVS